MNFRTLLIVVAMWAATTPLIAFAHPGEHGDFDEKPIPTDCTQLADTDQYTNDVSYPEIKALKEGCDAKEKVETESRKTLASEPKPE